MGDVIQVLDELTVQRQCRHDGKKSIYEIEVMFPEYLDRDNMTIRCDSEDASAEMFVNMITDIISYRE